MIAIIAAYDRNRVIGRDGHMPWHIPGEQRLFKKQTMGKALVMGRRTFHAIGSALPGRLNIVLSRSTRFEAPGCLVAHSLDEAIAMAGSLDIYISGGAQVYAQALPLADMLYLTEIDACYPGDCFFPEFDTSLFELIQIEPHASSVNYRYCTWRRKHIRPESSVI